MLVNLVLTVHVIVAASIVILVLLQHGKGADMGAAFGSGSAGSLFGSSGAANFLSRATAVCAAIFFTTSLALTYFHAPKASTGVMSGGVMQGVPAKTEPAKGDAGASAIPAPAASGTPAPAPATSGGENKPGTVTK
ncbi:MAG: preprotein translocase subunit SecG [Burkholderiales bacterium]|nr:preprotein translocase subunit SecG [Burkholderiales bacterium]